jgi:hypothetical protein
VADFVRDRGVAGAGVKYTTVSIMGPQSSGKSTLLNYLVLIDSNPCLMMRECVPCGLRPSGHAANWCCPMIDGSVTG